MFVCMVIRGNAVGQSVCVVPCFLASRKVQLVDTSRPQISVRMYAIVGFGLFVFKRVISVSVRVCVRVYMCERLCLCL